MLSIFFIGIALSMDAFSLALGLGTVQMNKKLRNFIPILIGVFHFVMPIIGQIISSKLSSAIQLNSQLLVIILFFYMGIVMIFSKQENSKYIIYNFFNIFLLAFSVSVDSFTVGLGLNAYDIKFLIPSTVFFVCSSLITYSGLIIGEYSVKCLKEKSPIVGGIIFWILAIVNIIQYLY